MCGSWCRCLYLPAGFYHGIIKTSAYRYWPGKIFRRRSKNAEMKMELNELNNTASQVRRDIVRMVHACQSGHPGGSLGCTDLLVALYFHEMKINETKGADGYLSFSRAGKNEDLFFLSNGHISPVF